MRILLVNDHGAILGGAEKYFFLLAQALKARGHELKTISSSHSRGKKLESDYQLAESGHCFNLDALFNPRAFIQMRKIVLDFQPDVIHFHNVFYTLSPSVLLATRIAGRGTRTVLTLHDYFSICLSDKTMAVGESCNSSLGTCMNCRKQCARPRFELLRRKIAGFALRRVNLLIAPSQYLEAEYRKNGFNQIEVLDHPVEQVAPASVSDVSRNRYQLLIVGRLASQKGVDVAIRALAIAIKDIAQLRLQIVGDGPQRQILEKLVEDLELKDVVEFKGWCNKQQVNRSYREAGVLLQPAIWPEVAGLTVAEAAAYGVPAIVSNIGALPESVVMGNGLIASPPADAQSLAEKIVQFFGSTQDYEKFSQNSLQFADSRRLENHLEKLEKLYTQEQ